MKPPKHDDSHLYANPHNFFLAEGGGFHPQRCKGGPYNSHFWPTQSWWLNHDLGHRFDSRFHFSYVELKDNPLLQGNRFCVDGATYHIHDNLDLNGKRNNFPTREAAIRASCARMIWLMRASRSWTGLFCGALKGKDLELAINWALQTCAQVCGRKAPRRVHVRIPPPPAPPPPKRINATAAISVWENL